MATDKDIYEAVKQVFTELVLPQLEALRADIRRLEKKLDAPPLMRNRNVKLPLSRPLSSRGQAYMDAYLGEISKDIENDAKKWAWRKAKDPKTRVLSEVS